MIVLDVLTRYFEGEANRAALHAKSGAALVEAMQASPYKDIDLQPTREPMPVRDAVL